MGNTLLRGGTVVTAVDTYAADVADRRRADRRDLRARPRRRGASSGRHHRRHGQVRPPRRHRRAHAPRHALRRHDARATTSRPARSRRRTAARRRIVDFAIQTKGEPLRKGLDTWHAQGRGQGRRRLRLPHDHDRRERRHGRRDGAAASTRASPRFKMFMAYPGVLPRRRRADLPRHAARRRDRRAHLHARRERHPHRRPGAAGPRQGPHRAHLPRAHAPAGRRGRGHPPRDLPRGDGRRARVHRAPLRRARARSRSSRRATAACPAFAETCPQYLFLLRGRPRAPGLRGGEVRVHAAAPPQARCRRTCGAASARTTSRSSRPTTARSA